MGYWVSGGNEEKAARWCEDLFNPFIPSGVGFVLSFQSRDYLEAIQLPPV